jgi:hypothetical protein
MNSPDSRVSDIDTNYLKSIATTTPKPLFSGAWTTVELQPDAFAPQRFTIGVVVQSPGERLHFKLLADYKKFDCLYHDQFPQKAVAEILQYAYETLTIASKAKTAIPEIRFETHCLSLATPAYTSGDDVEATVDRLYSEVVVMESSVKSKGKVFEPINTATARRMVNEDLKKIAAMQFEYIVPDAKKGRLPLKIGGQNHLLDLNILTSNACGSVTSAAYRAAQKVENNLLKSSLDLVTYSRVRNMKQIGLFLLMPDANLMVPKDFKKIEEKIEEHKWKLEQDGFQVFYSPSPNTLAQNIYDWAMPSL